MTKKDVFISIQEVRNPAINAQLVAQGIATQLEKRISHKRAMKKSVIASLAAGAQGIKIMCSGRLGGNVIARREWYREGRVPLHTFRADIDFGFAEALCTYGKIGIKVWVFKGEILDVKTAVESKDAVKSGKDAKEPAPEMVNLAKGGEEKKVK